MNASFPKRALAACCAAAFAAVLLCSGCSASSSDASSAQSSSGSSSATATDAGAVTELTSASSGSPAAAAAGSSELDADQARALSDFGLRLFDAAYPGKGNALASPMSAAYALAMTANGAAGQTLSQMEDAFGLQKDALNQALSAYAGRLATSELTLANSLWLREGMRVEQPFLDANATYYNAAVFEAPFDGSTVDAMNAWASEHTDGLVDGVVSELPDDAAMYLMNAAVFDAAWSDAFDASMTQEGEFTNEDGQAQTVDFMITEAAQYVENAQCSGMVKAYDGGDFAFMGLLPKEGQSVGDLVSSLDSDAVRELLDSAGNVDLAACWLPKFESACDLDLTKALADLGIVDALNPTADFSNLGTSESGTPLYIGGVAQKSVIKVDENGTKAAAVTQVAVETSLAPADRVETVVLDQPFVYLVVDTENGIPLFMGVMADMES